MGGGKGHLDKLEGRGAEALEREGVSEQGRDSSHQPGIVVNQGRSGALGALDWRTGEGRSEIAQVQGSGFRVQGSGFRVQGVGFGGP